MFSQAVDLCSDYSTNAATAAVTWHGGRSVLVTKAGTYPATTCKLQLLSPDGSTWIDISSNITANGVTDGMDLPAGQYRMNISGAPTGLYATLCLIPY